MSLCPEFYCSKCRVSHANECPPPAAVKWTSMAESLIKPRLGSVITYQGNHQPVYYCFVAPETMLATVQRAIKENHWIDWAVCSMHDYLKEGLTGRATVVPKATPNGWASLQLEPDPYMPNGTLLVSTKA